ncbi:MAG: hypothetical protein KA712_23530 [Myxococcales bacterium]|nr:hypothetical protein [Myxococcales bacterium]
MQKRRDDIIHIGLNEDSKREVEELRRLGNRVYSIQDSRLPDKVRVAGQLVDLDTPEGQEGFARSLHLQTKQADGVVAALRVGRLDTRDEISQLVQLFSRVERGVISVGRIVVSGHHARSNRFWGDDNGTLELKDFDAVAKVFPKAASAIEDLHLSACYSAPEMKAWLSPFPKLLTIWAYAGSAPGSVSGACAHLRAWDKATRGDSRWIDRLLVKNTRKGHNVAVWSSAFGYQSATIEAFAVIQERIQAFESTYQEYFSGQRIVDNPDQGPLREFYNDLQAALQHADCSPADRKKLEGRVDTTIRIIFYERSIRAKFAAHYRSQISSGYIAIGSPAPDFAVLTRKQALEAIAQFERSVARGPGPAAGTLMNILIGLRSLDERIVPIGWV